MTRIVEDVYATTTKIWYNFNENGITLSPGTKYYYKIFIVVNGVEYQTTTLDFTTKGHSHNYSSSVTTQPTCTKEGVRTYKCSCGASYTEAIAKTAHNSNTVIPAVAATCTKTGLTEGKKCSVCGTVIVAQTTVAQISHRDNNFDGKCDGCGISSTPDEPSDPKDDCSCNCHKGGLAGLFFKIINFIQKLFGMNTVCACGVKH